ncbi:MAG: BREX system P-loop protein BrxC, partial [Candidatus Cloacimonetes bacterium]|nr:BREX system P-loop protein BrxC [Candidatus Cloacimonadota bacterium]
SILFNIDQKADTGSPKGTDAILSVFVKAFNEACGYYGKHAYIAKFERDLDRDGLLEAFKAEYQRISGKDWKIGRAMAEMEDYNVSKAYASIKQAPEGSVNSLLSDYSHNYKISIEEFAQNVAEYIGKKEKGFRLIFCVDEIGQFIADSTKLMLNLQTISESFDTVCKGRAWIMVTSQADLETVVGQLKQAQSTEYGRIAARFPIKLNLGSSNVEEVIQKRLLLKKTEHDTELLKLYHKHENSMRTLFQFGAGSRTYRSYQDSEDFMLTYPFIPYQSFLLQSAFISLSEHDAFSGKYTSVGARSLLSIFQLVLVRLAEKQVSSIAAFDMMYAGIKDMMKTHLLYTIETAQAALGESLPLRILKTLFILKYVKDFKATIRNIRILLLEDLQTDPETLNENIKQALDLLERETYIERNGEEYSYLTSDEKTIEQQIKNTQIEESAISDELDKLMFGYNDFLKAKIRHDESGQDFAYSRKVDDRAYGKAQEMTVQLITPNYQYYDQEQQLKFNSMGKAELLIILPADNRFWDDLALYKKTDKYCSQQAMTSISDSTRLVVATKQQQNSQRMTAIKKRFAELVSSSKLVLRGELFSAKSSEAVAKIGEAAQALISRSYPNLAMIKAVRDMDFGSVILSSQANLDELVELSEAERDMLGTINLAQGNTQKLNLSTLIQKYMRNPYGWSESACLYILAKLISLCKAEVYAQGRALEKEELIRELRQKDKYSTLIIQPQAEISQTELHKLKKTAEELMGHPALSTDGKALTKELIEALKSEASMLKVYLEQQDLFVFLACLEDVIKQYKEIAGKPANWFFNEFKDQEAEMLKQKRDLIDPIKRFMESPQATIYKSIHEFIKDNKLNISHLDTDSIKTLQDVLADQKIYIGSKIKDAKPALEFLKDQLTRLLNQERQKALQEVTPLYESLKAKVSGKQDLLFKIEEAYQQVLRSINQETLIPMIASTKNYFTEHTYLDLLNEIEADIAPKGSDKPKTMIISAKSLKPKFSKEIIETGADLDEYLKSLKQAYLTELDKGNRIKV